MECLPPSRARSRGAPPRQKCKITPASDPNSGFRGSWSWHSVRIPWAVDLSRYMCFFRLFEPLGLLISQDLLGFSSLRFSWAETT